MKEFLLKCCIAAGLLLFVSGHSFAQHEAMYSQYMFNGLVLNPAYAGSTDALSAAALHRKQWVGIEGAPSTQTVSIHAPVASKKVGLGLTLINDRIGVTNNLGVNAAYAYRILTSRGAFAMGLQTGINQFYADFTGINTRPDRSQDNAFMDMNNFLMFNCGTGFYYYTDKFYAGLSVPYLYNTKITGFDQSVGSPNRYRHYFLTTGYVFSLSENAKLKPSTMIKVAEGAPIQFDLNTNIWLYNFLGLGASYRSSDAVVGIVEMQIARQFRFSYAYDQPVSKLRRFNSNTHEVMIRFDLVSPENKFVSPRFF